MKTAHRIPSLALLCVLVATSAAAQAPDTTPAPATNFVRVDANFATGGATTAEQLAALRKLGFRAVVNLRTATEPGADLEGEAKSAADLGFLYFSLPFSVSAPDAGVVDKFLEIVKDAGNQPLYIHCQSGQRANTFLMIKRVIVDGWTTEKAQGEADTLKMTNQKLRDFALAYIKDHAK